MAADGSIKIVTEIVTEGFKSGKRTIEKGLQSLKGSINKVSDAMFGIGQSSNKAFESARMKAKDTEAAIAEVEKRMEGIRKAAETSGGSMSKAFQKAKTQVDATKQSLAELEARRDAMAQAKIARAVPAGLTQKDLPDGFVDKTLKQDPEIKELDRQIAQAARKLDTYQAKLREAKAESTGLTGEAAREFRSLEKRLGNLNTKLAQYKKRMSEAKKENSLFSRIAGKVKSAFSETAKSAKTAGKQTGNTARMIKGMLLSMVLFSVVAGAMKAITDGIQKMAKGSEKANAVLSNLATNFLYLKNSIASAVMPILQALTPVIMYITNALANLFGMIGMVSARLFGGATTFTKAKKASVDYAKSLDKTGKSAKEASKQLAAFDELNVLDQSNGDGSGSAGGMPAPGDMFEEVPISPEAMSIADKMKEWMGELREATEPTIEAFGRLKESLEPLKTFVATGLLDFYRNFLVPVGNWALGEGIPRFLDLLGEMVQDIDWPKLNESLAGLWTQLSKVATFVGNSLIDFFEYFLKPLGTWTMNKALPRLVDVLTKGLAKVDWEKIRGALQRLWKVLEPFAEKVGEGLLWFFEHVLVPIGTWILNDAVPAFLDLLTAAIDLVNIAIEKAKPLLSWMWDNFLVPVAQWTGGLIVEALNSIADACNKIAEGDWKGAGEAIVNGLLSGIGSLWDLAVELGRNLIDGFKDFLGIHSPSTVMADMGGNLIEGLVNGLTLAWSNITTWIANSFSGFISDVESYFTIEKWKEIVSAIKDGLTEKWDEFVTWWGDNGVVAWIRDYVMKYFTLEYWTGIYSNIKAAIVSKWNEVIGWWSAEGGSKWINDHVVPLFKLETWLGYYKNIKEALVATFKNGIEGAIALVNRFIGWLNEKMHFKWDPIRIGGVEIVPGGDVQLFTIPLLPPKLATGAVIPPNAEFLATLGDQKNGRNLEAPEGLIREMLDDALEKHGTNQTVTVEMPVYLDGREIYRNQKKIEWQRGKSLVKGATI